MKKIISISIICFVVISNFLLINSAHAMQIIKPNSSDQANVKLESDEKIDDNIITFGNEIIIRGEINDNVFAFGQKVKISGKVHGSVFVGANDVEISGEVDKDVFTGASFVTISEEARIGRDLIVGASSININGIVGRDIWAGTSSLNINGKVLGNINTGTNYINIGNEASVSGVLKYYASQELKITNKDKISGGVEFNTVQQKKKSFATQFNNWILKILMALVTGILLLIIFPKRTEKIADSIKDNWIKSLGIGFLVLIAVPIVAMICMVLIVGLPVSLIIWALYFIFIYLAKIWISLCLGKNFAPQKWNIFWKFVLGLIALYLLFLIPYIGPLVSFGAVIAGLGGLYQSKPLEEEKK